jgi:hypothetical protein
MPHDCQESQGRYRTIVLHETIVSALSSGSRVTGDGPLMRITRSE